jgi:hypothetical protein
VSKGFCTYTWSMCAERSGKGHSNPHLCMLEKGHPGPHECTACQAPG